MKFSKNHVQNPQAKENTSSNPNFKQHSNINSEIDTSLHPRKFSPSPRIKVAELHTPVSIQYNLDSLPDIEAPFSGISTSEDDH